MASYLSAALLVALLGVAYVAGEEGEAEFATEEKDEGGYCKTHVEQDLDIQKLKGDWWEEESFNTDSFLERDDKCHVSHFYPSADKKKIEVSFDYVSTAKNNEHKKSSFVIQDKDEKNDGNLLTHLHIIKPDIGNQEVEYDILETDYDNFMLVQLCYDGPATQHDFKTGLLLVRKPTGIDLNSAEIEPQISAALKKNNLDRSFFQANDIKACAAVKFPDTFTASK